MFPVGCQCFAESPRPCSFTLSGSCVMLVAQNVLPSMACEECFGQRDRSVQVDHDMAQLHLHGRDLPRQPSYHWPTRGEMEVRRSGFSGASGAEATIEQRCASPTFGILRHNRHHARLSWTRVPAHAYSCLSACVWFKSAWCLFLPMHPPIRDVP